MISHKYKCIFIHIPRTAGTSIEKWICGKSWWVIEPETKHLTASQAKEIYKDYWDDYFKFSFVRNPWDRMVSCLKFKNYFKLNCSFRGVLKLRGYKKQFGYPLTIENDYRFSNKKDLLNKSPKKYRENSVYLNILNEEIDFVGKFENLKEDVEYIKKKLKIKEDFNIDAKLDASSERGDYRNYYNERTKKEIEELFQEDIDFFNYKF